jgi:acyl-CoA synthetase (AMP-forming)/AMP-acid ligase II
LIAMLVVGFPAVVLPSFHAHAAIESCNRHRVTMAGGSTAFYQAFLNVQREQRDTPILPWVRLFAGGGAPMPPALWHEIREEIGVRTLHGYAMTEAPMAAMGRWEHTDDELATTAGTPVRGMEMRVVGGEIQLRGKTLFRGYTDPALDRECWDGDWFRTGDVGEIRDGHLVVTGRIKDIIIRKGENISAVEVENLIATHPSVQAVAVIGLPDEARGELVCACVELRPAKTLTLEELAEHLRDLNVMPQKVPERLEIGRLPRGGTLQKVLKTELRERLL